MYEGHPARGLKAPHRPRKQAERAAHPAKAPPCRVSRSGANPMPVNRLIPTPRDARGKPETRSPPVRKAADIGSKHHCPRHAANPTRRGQPPRHALSRHIFTGSTRPTSRGGKGLQTRHTIAPGSTSLRPSIPAPAQLTQRNTANYEHPGRVVCAPSGAQPRQARRRSRTFCLPFRHLIRSPQIRTLMARQRRAVKRSRFFGWAPRSPANRTAAVLRVTRRSPAANGVTGKRIRRCTFHGARVPAARLVDQRAIPWGLYYYPAGLGRAPNRYTH